MMMIVIIIIIMMVMIIIITIDTDVKSILSCTPLSYISYCIMLMEYQAGRISIKGCVYCDLIGGTVGWMLCMSVVVL